MLAGQNNYYPECRKVDLVIHIGEISGSYYGFKKTNVWRVNEDGEVRDPFKMLTSVFEMDELSFFRYYNSKRTDLSTNTVYEEYIRENKKLEQSLPELPLSNVWLCLQTAKKLPENAVLHLGILNSLRSWNLFDAPNSVYTYSNVGGFGIDGILSACIGASLADREKLYFCVLGDLALFYDLNILGNRHIGNNVRILVSNNGTGFEMHCAGSIGREFGSDADRYFAAGGHFGNKSHDVLRHFASDLGFEYLKADTKEEYLAQLDYFVSPDMYDQPILFEVFVREEDDDEAYNKTKNLAATASGTAKQIARTVLGERGYENLKNRLRKK